MGKIVAKRANGDYRQWSGVSLEVTNFALRDAHMADAVDTYFKARPQLMRTIHEERIYEAGFKAAWDRLQSALSEATARAERAEAELKAAREPVATVYIGSGHCKVAFTDAAKEAMKGRQGQSFDVYSYPMPRAAKESLTVESVAAQVPQEWRDFVASVAENKLLQPDCVCERCEWTRKAIALLHEVKP